MGEIKDNPILFSGPMIRALRDGAKTQTRRVVKPQPRKGEGVEFWDTGCTANPRPLIHYGRNLHENVFRESVRCPYGKPGDLLVIRETWQYADWTQDGAPYIRYRADGAERLIEDIPDHWSDRLQDSWAALSDPANYNIDSKASDRRWRPAIHMPRWASRLTLRITDVRVQRLQECSNADAMAEGIGTPLDERYAAAHEYRALWESINGPGSWTANPWVWAITFEVIHQNVDAYLASMKVAA